MNTNWLDYTLLTLVIIGAINWGLIGFLDFNLVSFLFGKMSWWHFFSGICHGLQELFMHLWELGDYICSACSEESVL